VFLATALSWLVALVTGCSGGPAPTGSGPHSCADCAQALACCQAVLAAEGQAGYQCSTSDTVCASIGDIEQQREYIAGCDAYVMAHASGDAAPAACQ
jgi:hypothetical protein